MAARKIGAVVVVSDDGKAIGLLTDRDVTLRVVAEGRAPERTTVEDVMSPSVTCLSLDATIERATESMRDAGVRRLPIIDDQQHVIGLVSFDDIVLLLGMELGNLAAALFTRQSTVAENEPRLPGD